MKLFKQIVSEDKLILSKYYKILNQITSYADRIAEMPDKKLVSFTYKFQLLLKRKQKTLNEILPLAFAIIREAAKRTIHQYPYEEQLLAGIILHYGDCAEMKTGEGKTLASIMPIYLNSLAKKGVIVVTTNEYLAERDYLQNKKILKFLNITAGFVSADHDYKKKQINYQKDVTYITNYELGFDYLRDNMVGSKDQEVQRSFNYCIVDECDSVLIDESRTPLIIAGGAREYKWTYTEVNDLVKTLVPSDYKIDVESQSINLTNDGKFKIEKFYKLNNLFNAENDELFHLVINSLRANFIFEREEQYIIQDGKIVLVDKSTGRIMKGRTYSDGLHQAIEAKEGLEITDETTIVSTISYQNLFRLFNKMGGMTGTAKTEEDEFQEIYNMRVLQVPTHKPIIRIDAPDYIFQNTKAKYKALLHEIELRHSYGQPILIGTKNIDDSEYISDMLKQLKIKHNILNAKNHMKEAKIIAKAGEENNVTIATNMAGRGTDIKLTSISKKAGGLCVLATDRHESRRIDNQLRGRAGRQGDPGYSRFYLSLEDELIIRFGGKSLRGLFSALGDVPLESKLVAKKLNNAQKKVEGMNFDSRKSLLEYDNVLSEQREIMYNLRRKILHSNDIYKMLLVMIEEIIYKIATACYKETDIESQYDLQKFINLIHGIYLPYGYMTTDDLKQNTNDLVGYTTDLIYDTYLEKHKMYPDELVVQIEKQIFLNSLDHFWTMHIDNMVKLRSSIYLRSYGQKNPLQQYIEEGSKYFNNMKENISVTVIMNLNSADYNEILTSIINKNPQHQQQVKVKMQ